jgi:amino acid adenylation domain-containing protein
MTLATTDPTISGTVIDLIDRQTRTRPESLCVADPDLRLSYQDFARLTAEFAEVVSCYGLARGELVAVTGGPSAAIVSLAVAIWRAGGAFLLFDPAQPAARQQELRADAGVRLTITVADDRIDVAEDGAWTPIEGIEHAEQLAYVVYTSGSTGRPKGVLVRHSALLPVMRMKDTQFGIVAGDRIAMLAPLHVEGVLFEILAALTSGASLHIPTAEQRRPGPALDGFLRTERISVLVATPSRLRDLDPAAFPALRVVISAGEDLPVDTARRWASGRLLFNSYGVTEATIATTCVRIEPGVTAVPIGRAIAHNGVRILDESLRPVPRGAVGELFISGSGVALGYLNRPDLTAERFVEIDGERLYRSGDYVREAPDGLLYFAGRRDDQIQLAGFRVEPGEVRAALSSHPELHDCAVRAVDGRLVAYVVPRDDTRPTAAQLRNWLAGLLTKDMIPTRFITVPALPQTPWGKIDYRALPDPATVTVTTDEQPHDKTQDALAALAAELLDIAELPGLADDLFLLGLTSILVATLIRRVNDEFGVLLGPVDVFERPTIGELAQLVGKLGAVV